MSFFERQLLRTSNSLYIAHSDLNFQRLSLYQKITILLRIHSLQSEMASLKSASLFLQILLKKSETVAVKLCGY